MRYDIYKANKQLLIDVAKTEKKNEITEFMFSSNGPNPTKIITPITPIIKLVNIRNLIFSSKNIKLKIKLQTGTKELITARYPDGKLNAA